MKFKLNQVLVLPLLFTASPLLQAKVITDLNTGNQIDIVRVTDSHSKITNIETGESKVVDGHHDYMTDELYTTLMEQKRIKDKQLQDTIDKQYSIKNSVTRSFSFTRSTSWKSPHQFISSGKLNLNCSFSHGTIGFDGLDIVLEVYEVDSFLWFDSNILRSKFEIKSSTVTNKSFPFSDLDTSYYYFKVNKYNDYLSVRGSCTYNS